jgi:hypothetical protein
MNISWVLADSTDLDHKINLLQLKELGSFWGGWKTWRAYQTDNVVCHNIVKAKDLIQREFHRTCNFYIPNSIYATLGRPEGVKLYEGNFVHEVDNQEEIVAMHLASQTSDIVLLLGFDFTEQEKNADKLLEHRANNYRNLTKGVIKNTPNTQWVVVDHLNPLRPDLLELENLGTDSLKNILQ